MSAGQIVAAVLAVALAALIVWKRRSLSGERKAARVAAVLVLAVYASGVLSALPDPKKLIEDIAQALGPWTYALVGVLAFLETGRLRRAGRAGRDRGDPRRRDRRPGRDRPDPADRARLGLRGARRHHQLLHRPRLGRGFLERHGPRVKITHERLSQVEGYFDRHGGKTILIGRFIGLVRALAPFIAGSSGLAYRRFLPYSVVGTGLWATIFCVLGYIFWRSFDKVADIAGTGDLRLRDRRRR